MMLKQTEGTLLIFEHVRPYILDMPSQHSGPVLKLERKSGVRCCLKFIRPNFSTVIIGERLLQPHETSEFARLFFFYRNNTMEKGLLQPYDDTPKVETF